MVGEVKHEKLSLLGFYFFLFNPLESTTAAFTRTSLPDAAGTEGRRRDLGTADLG